MSEALEQPALAVVTGGASGIGLASVEILLSRGWHVIAADRDEGTIARLAAREPAFDGRLTALVLDVTDEAAIAALARTCAGRKAPLRALVNNAGIAANVRFHDTTPDLFRKIYEVNVIGAFGLAHALAPLMREAGGGSIVNISSVSGIRGSLGRSAYGASKGALVTLTRIMAVELADEGIRVNAIAPGPVETPMAKSLHSDAVREEWRRTVPLRRYGEPSEIAEAIAFLCDGASSYVTGQILAVDGGFTAAGLMN